MQRAAQLRMGMVLHRHSKNNEFVVSDKHTKISVRLGFERYENGDCHTRSNNRDNETSCAIKSNSMSQVSSHGQQSQRDRLSHLFVSTDPIGGVVNHSARGDVSGAEIIPVFEDHCIDPSQDPSIAATSNVPEVEATHVSDTSHHLMDDEFQPGSMARQEPPPHDGSVAAYNVEEDHRHTIRGFCSRATCAWLMAIAVILGSVFAGFCGSGKCRRASEPTRNGGSRSFAPSVPQTSPTVAPETTVSPITMARQTL